MKPTGWLGTFNHWLSRMLSERRYRRHDVHSHVLSVSQSQSISTYVRWLGLLSFARLIERRVKRSVTTSPRAWTRGCRLLPLSHPDNEVSPATVRRCRQSELWTPPIPNSSSFCSSLSASITQVGVHHNSTTQIAAKCAKHHHKRRKKGQLQNCQLLLPNNGRSQWNN